MSGMNARDALEVVRDARGPRDVVITTMGTARDWTAGGIGPLDFVLVPSSMGQATSLGLGLALSQPDRRIIVLNGDGSMLMNLGSLVTIAAQAPANLAVVLFANGIYEITGAQPTPGAAAGRAGGDPVDFEALARGAGFRSVFRFADLAQWGPKAAAVIAAPGPTFVVLEVAADSALSGIGPRSPGPASARAAAFVAALGGSAR
ncbi:MAG: thiamine pyrophosphate-dependent enzyme [Gemmatimonadales bacterium]